MTDRLVSTAVLRDRRKALEEEVESQKKFRPDTDPFFRTAAWLLAEWEQAERDAARHYAPTAEAARLTGWSEPTLRSRARAAKEGRALPEGWEELIVRADGNEWSFVVSTIPVKSTQAA